MILNEMLSFEMAPNDVRRTFRGQLATKTLLPCNHCLFKFTAHSLFKPDGTVTPFWSSVEPIAAGDPGLAGLQQRAAALQTAPAEFGRARSAVTRQWNPMTGLLRVRLLRPVHAFVGQCSGQLIDKDASFSNVLFIGGAWQLWIPNLDASFVAQISSDPM